MRLTLRQLQIFLAVAETGTTAAAAGKVYITQSASSAALRELENLLHCQLFDRVGKHLVLNDNGRQLLPQARVLLDGANHIELQFQPEQPNSLSGLFIGSSTTIGIYLLPSLLAKFGGVSQPDHAKITIANTDDIVRAVKNFEVDAGFIEGYCHAPELLVEPWLNDELIIVASPRHPLATQKNNVSLAQLRDQNWLLREVGSGTREAVEHVLLPHLHKLTPAAELSNSEAIKHAAVAGLGLACLSRLVVQDLLQLGKLIEIHSALPALHRPFYMIRARNKFVSARLDRFLKFCRNGSISSHNTINRLDQSP